MSGEKLWPYGGMPTFLASDRTYGARAVWCDLLAEGDVFSPDHLKRCQSTLGSLSPTEFEMNAQLAES